MYRISALTLSVLLLTLVTVDSACAQPPPWGKFQRDTLQGFPQLQVVRVDLNATVDTVIVIGQSLDPAWITAIMYPQGSMTIAGPGGATTVTMTSNQGTSAWVFPQGLDSATVVFTSDDHQATATWQKNDQSIVTIQITVSESGEPNPGN